MRILCRHFGLAKARHGHKSIAQRFDHCSATSSGKRNWPAMAEKGLPWLTITRFIPRAGDLRNCTSTRQRAIQPIWTADG
jgi:hypothetical protein